MYADLLHRAKIVEEVISEDQLHLVEQKPKTNLPPKSNGNDNQKVKRQRIEGSNENPNDKKEIFCNFCKKANDTEEVCRFKHRTCLRCGDPNYFARDHPKK